MVEKGEIEWINWVRALCILLVFFAHSVDISGQAIPDWIHNLYYYVYVNAFFFVSGYLLMGRQLSSPIVDESPKRYLAGSGKKLLGNILFRIVIPSVIFSVVEYFPKMLLRGGEISLVSFVAETFGGGTYWFLSALAIAQLLFWVLLITRIRSVWFYVGCSVVLALTGMAIDNSGFAILGFDDSFPWKYKQGMVCMLFLAAGALYERYFRNSSIPVWLLVVLSCVYLLGCVFLPEYMGDASALFCSVQLSGFVWSLIGIICLIGLCRRLPGSGLVRFVGRNSILFYMMSGAIPTVLTILVTRFFTLNVLSFLSIFVLSFVSAAVLSMVIVRYLPFLKDLRMLKH